MIARGDLPPAVPGFAPTRTAVLAGVMEYGVEPSYASLANCPRMRIETEQRYFNGASPLRSLGAATLRIRLCEDHASVTRGQYWVHTFAMSVRRRALELRGARQSRVEAVRQRPAAVGAQHQSARTRRSATGRTARPARSAAARNRRRRTTQRIRHQTRRNAAQRRALLR